MFTTDAVRSVQNRYVFPREPREECTGVAFISSLSLGPVSAVRLVDDGRVAWRTQDEAAADGGDPRQRLHEALGLRADPADRRRDARG